LSALRPRLAAKSPSPPVSFVSAGVLFASSIQTPDDVKARNINSAPSLSLRATTFLTWLRLHNDQQREYRGARGRHQRSRNASLALLRRFKSWRIPNPKVQINATLQHQSSLLWRERPSVRGKTHPHLNSLPLRERKLGCAGREKPEIANQCQMVKRRSLDNEK
jgi:hypothetical protein